MPSELLSLFEERGCSCLLCTSMEEILERIQEGKAQLIIADAAANEVEASYRIVELSLTKELFDTPLIFLHGKVSKPFDMLKRDYKWFKTIQYPYKPDYVLAAVNALVKRCRGDEFLPRKLRSFSEISKSGGFKQQPAFNARARLAQCQNPSRLIEGYGGEIFAIASDSSHFTDQYLLPPHSCYAEIAQELQRMTKRSEWLGTHARRVTFAVAAMAAAFAMPKEFDRAMRVAALFADWALQELAGEALQADLLSSPSKDDLLMFAEGLLQSAQQVRSKFKDEQAALILEAGGNAILKSKAGKETSNDLTGARIVILVELATRACWKDKTWNPYGAYRVIQTLEQENDLPPYVDAPEAARLVRKMLVEAVSKHVTLRNAFVPDAAAQEPAAAPAAGNPAAATRTIPITELKPGMKLAAPLQTRDGKTVLQAFTELDRPAVERLWRLAAVRAVDSKAVIVDERPKGKQRQG